MSEVPFIRPIALHPILAMASSWLTWVGTFLVASVPVLQAMALLFSIAVSMISIVVMLEKRRERRGDGDNNRMIEP